MIHCQNTISDCYVALYASKCHQLNGGWEQKATFKSQFILQKLDTKFTFQYYQILPNQHIKSIKSTITTNTATAYPSTDVLEDLDTLEVAEGRLPVPETG